MRVFARISACMLAASLAAAGCTKPAAVPAPTPPPRPTATTAKMTFTYPIAACPLGTAPDASENYIITLGPSFQLTKPNAGKSGHKEGAPRTPRPHPTKLDIVTDLLDANKVGTVTIALSDPRLNFAAHDVAFTGADANAPNVFCGVTFAADGRSLTFTVRPIAAQPYASYTLGLIADDQDPHSKDTLAVFIDPGVDNDGLAMK